MPVDDLVRLGARAWSHPASHNGAWRKFVLSWKYIVCTSWAKRARAWWASASQAKAVRHGVLKAFTSARALATGHCLSRALGNAVGAVRVDEPQRCSMPP